MNTQDFIANVAILNKQLQKESWDSTFWAPFSGDVQVETRPNGQPVYKPSGKPIEILSQFKSQGRDNMLTPFQKNFVNAPVFGDTQLKGTGIPLEYKWLRTYINQARVAITPREGFMSEQRAEATIKMYENSKPALVELVSRYHNQQITKAILEGLSDNLSASKTVDGLGLYKRYNANFYYHAGSGVITAVGTEGKTKSAAELDTAVGNVDGNNISAAMLSALRIKCLRLRMPRLYNADVRQKFWPMVISPEQRATLYADSTFVAAQNSAFTGKMLEHPMLKNAIAYYDGFVLFEDIEAVRGWSAGFFGADMDAMMLPTTVTTNACAIVFGPSMLAKGVAQKLAFTTETDDHENTVEIGAREIYGYNRADFVDEDDADEDTSGLFAKNTTGGVADGFSVEHKGSLVIMTDEN